MESEDSTTESGGVDDLELMCVVAQTIISNNVMLMRYLSRRRKSQQLRNQEAALEQLLFPSIVWICRVTERSEYYEPIAISGIVG
jgi:hypothetical protein